MGALLYADDGPCVELVYPRDCSLPSNRDDHGNVTSTSRTTIRHAGGMGYQALMADY